MSNTSPLKPVVLFRRGNMVDDDEFMMCERYLPTYEDRRAIPPGSLVVGRYSVLPYYRETGVDISLGGCMLINDYQQHRWIANHGYYDELKLFMPLCWTEDEFVHSDYQGPFVVKGRTNSRKHQWDTQMFAQSRSEAIEIAVELKDDPLIAGQGIIYKAFVPLVTYEYGINGLPFSNEWRFFFLGEREVARGYYWSEAHRPELACLDGEGIAVAHMAAKRIAQRANFFAIDVAQTQANDWLVMDVNDGQMSGLSMIEPNHFYSRLAAELKEFKPCTT